MPKFTDSFQNLILAACVSHPDKFTCYGPLIGPKMFTGVHATVAAKVLADYYEKHGTYPPWTIFEQHVVHKAGRIGVGEDEEVRAQEFVNVLRETTDSEIRGPAEVEHIAGQVVEFCRYQAMVNAIKSNIELIKDGKDLNLEVCEQAMQIGIDLQNMGILLSSDMPDTIDDVVNRVTKSGYGIRTGFPLLDQIWRNGWGPGWLIVPLAPPKGYKCLGKGTGVLMFDGTVKPVEQIKVGDLLMGDDSTPRTVLTCGSGHGPLYHVKQAHGMDFVCNDAHILCLKSEDGAVLEITAEDLEKIQGRKFAEVWSGFKRNGAKYAVRVEPIGPGEYYGFEIDGNRRFLLSDFTVTHNTTWCINLALNMAGPAIAEDVLYYSLEITDDLAAVRAMCNFSGQKMDDMYGATEKFKQTAKSQLNMSLAGEILFKGFPSRMATIKDLRAHAKMAVQQGLRPKAIFIDYADTVKPSASHKEKQDYLLQSDVYTEARALGHELGACVIMPDRCNKETVNLPVPNITSFQGAFAKGGIVDIAFGLCMTDAERKNNVFRVFNFLQRHGPALQHFMGRIDPETFKMELLKEIEYNPEESGRSGKQRDKLPELPEEF